jgi:subtilisin-like proprotein convertase family protein
LLVVSAGAAIADTNQSPIAVPLLGTSGVASPYPSRITVAAPGGPTQTGQVQVVLQNVTHRCPEQLAVLLSHAGVSYVLMANAGGCKPLAGTDIVFSVLGTATIPDNDSSTVPYDELIFTLPSIFGSAPSFPAPAPAGPFVNGLPPATTPLNGDWDLFVIDQTPGDRGVIASGWALHFSGTIEKTSTPTFVAIPDSGPAAPVTFDLSDLPPDVRVLGFTLRLVLSHTFPSDLEIILRSAEGTPLLIMNDAGGATPITNVDLRFSLAAAMLSTAPITSGTYLPGFTTVGVTNPPAGLQTRLASFTDQLARGVWQLQIFDDTAGDSGTLVSATLTVLTDTPVLTFTIDTPTTAPATTATQPFLRVAGTIEFPNPASPISATWRSVVNGVYYASGPMTFPSTGVIRGDLPLKQGTNLITVTVRNRKGSISSLSIESITVTVSEFDYYLTEGATGSFFDMDIGLANPSPAPAPVTLSFLPEGGVPIPHADLVAANAQLLLHGDDFVTASGTATVVRSTNAQPLAVERSMFWDASYYGGHGGTAVDGASTRWLFAEGSQGFFDTFLLLANDNAAAVTTTVRFLREGGTPVIITPSIGAHSRITIYAGLVAGLPGSSFGIDVTASQPITAERAMYFPNGGPRTFEGGHESAGVTETSRTWFLAEGATGPFFECFVLVSNPNATPANVTYTYLLAGGGTVVRNATIAANSRVTVNVETVDPQLANVAVSTTVTSDVGVVAERAMYWPDISVGWQEAHNSFGVPVSGLRWGLADGRVGGALGYQTYVLLANPNAVVAEVQVRFLKPGVAPVVRTFTLPATSRQNIFVNGDVPELGDGNFGVDVQVMNYQPIAVEKSMYWNSGGVVFAGGSNVTASRLPPP